MFRLSEVSGARAVAELVNGHETVWGYECLMRGVADDGSWLIFAELNALFSILTLPIPTSQTHEFLAF